MKVEQSTPTANRAFLEQVALAPTCLLQQVLFWLAFQRLPTTYLDIHDESMEDHESVEIRLWDPDFISPLESQKADLPIDPRYNAIIDQGEIPEPPEEHQTADPNWPDWLRDNIEYQRTQAKAFRVAWELWEPMWKRVLEIAASKAFLAFADGRLPAEGMLLPAVDIKEALASLNMNDQRLARLTSVRIPPQFWSLPGIDWAASMATNGRERYCWISCDTHILMDLFPPDTGRPVAGLREVGAFYVLESSASIAPPPLRTRGRPAPEPSQTNPGSIGLLRVLMNAPLDHSPSRTAIGERLKPYYGLPYYNPHSFRHTLVTLGQQLCQTPEEFKAWSQNLGHESPLTTFVSYGQVSFTRQAEIIRRLSERRQLAA